MLALGYKNKKEREKERKKDEGKEEEEDPEEVNSNGRAGGTRRNVGTSSGVITADNATHDSVCSLQKRRIGQKMKIASRCPSCFDVSLLGQSLFPRLNKALGI